MITLPIDNLFDLYKWTAVTIDVFKIKQFLPKEFGDSVVIPSALVKKVGSDFDIDKLYLHKKSHYKFRKY